MEKWALPDKWEWHRIDEVCKVNPRRPRFDRDEDVPTSFVPMAAVNEDKGAITDMEVRPYREVMHGYTYFEEGDVLFAKITPSMENGKSAIAYNLIDGIGFGSTEFHRLRPKEQVISEWVHYYVRQGSFRREAATYFRGSVGQQRVPKEFLSDHPIPVPPLDVQEHLVTQINRFLEEVTVARASHSNIDENIEGLMRSVLGEVFFEPVDANLSKGWKIKSVSEISDKPQYGYTQSASNEPIGPKFLRISDIQDRSVNWNEVPYCECNVKDLAKYRLQKGDLVFARSGATTGKTYLVQDPPEAVFASYLIRLQIQEFALPEYVYWFFQSPYYWQQITPRGAAQPNVNAQVLGSLRLPIPVDESRQRQIVAYLDDIQAKVREMTEIQNSNQKLLERLEQAILDQAFHGEL